MNLIVYGSLLNKKELLKEGIILDNVETVKVYGYRRVFNQEPSYRFVDSVNRAVLNVIEDKNYWFNAIVIKELPSDYFKILDKREKGYNRIQLKDSCVKTYSGNSLNDCVIYLGKKEKTNIEILPNLDYLEICKKGINTFSTEFVDDFYKTTYKNSENGLILI